jgi:hypothetical protein
MPAAATAAVDDWIDRLGREQTRFDATIGGALQDAINAIDTAEGARDLILRAAESAHARFPHYDGHWRREEWQIGVIDSRVESAMGVAFEGGDVVLWHEPTLEDIRFAERDGLPPCPTAYSVRFTVDSAIEDVDVRPWAER